MVKFDRSVCYHYGGIQKQFVRLELIVMYHCFGKVWPLVISERKQSLSYNHNRLKVHVNAKKIPDIYQLYFLVFSPL